MSDLDTANTRRSRLKALRAEMEGDEDELDQEVNPTPSRPGWRGAGPATGGARRRGGDFPGGAMREGNVGAGGGFAGGARRQGQGGGGFAGGARRPAGGGNELRARILSSLRDVDEGDQLIEGTDIGQDNLENLMDALERAESTGLGGKLGEIVMGLLDPVETDDGLEFSPEGVAKLVAFLEKGAGGGQRQRPGPGGLRRDGPPGGGIRRGKRGKPR